MFIFPHTNSEDEADYNLISVGQILLGFQSKNITTKTYKNKIVTAGNSKRNLKDFVNYSSYSDGAFLRFENGSLTTKTPNIFLSEVQGVNISGEAEYLALTSSNQIINTSRKEYTVGQLSDTIDTSAPNKYALTYNGTSWVNLPEASALGRFDDVNFSTVPYGVFVSYFAPIGAGGFGTSYRILPLSISWDGKPNLGESLDANSKSVFNLNYLCQNLEATTPISSFVIDTLYYSEANISCSSDVKVLDIEILVNNNHLKFHTLNINNFIGLLNFKSQADIVFENGYLPKMSESTNTYTLMLYKDNVKIKVIILYKNRNLKYFSNNG